MNVKNILNSKNILKFKGLLATLLLIIFVFVFISGLILEFKEVNFIHNLTKNLEIEEFHATIGYIFAFLVLIHFILNFKVYKSEIRMLLMKNKKN